VKKKVDWVAKQVKHGIKDVTKIERSQTPHVKISASKGKDKIEFADGAASAKNHKKNNKQQKGKSQKFEVMGGGKAKNSELTVVASHNLAKTTHFPRDALTLINKKVPMKTYADYYNQFLNNPASHSMFKTGYGGAPTDLIRTSLDIQTVVSTSGFYYVYVLPQLGSAVVISNSSTMSSTYAWNSTYAGINVNSMPLQSYITSNYDRAALRGMSLEWSMSLNELSGSSQNPLVSAGVFADLSQVSDLTSNMTFAQIAQAGGVETTYSNSGLNGRIISRPCIAAGLDYGESYILAPTSFYGEWQIPVLAIQGVPGQKLYFKATQVWECTSDAGNNTYNPLMDNIDESAITNIDPHTLFEAIITQRTFESANVAWNVGPMGASTSGIFTLKGGDRTGRGIIPYHQYKYDPPKPLIKECYSRAAKTIIDSEVALATQQKMSLFNSTMLQLIDGGSSSLTDLQENCNYKAAISAIDLSLDEAITKRLNIHNRCSGRGVLPFSYKKYLLDISPSENVVVSLSSSDCATSFSSSSMPLRKPPLHGDDQISINYRSNESESKDSSVDRLDEYEEIVVPLGSEGTLTKVLIKRANSQNTKPIKLLNPTADAKPTFSSLYFSTPELLEK
jgi:hypothetical protein